MNAYKSPWMTEELELFRDSVRRFVEAEIAPHQERWNKQQHVDRDIWNKAGEIGMLLPDIAEEYGGSGGNFAHDAVVYEELVYADNTSFGKAVHSIGAHYVQTYGTDDQKQRWLPKMATGELVGAIAMTEPGTGSDLQNIKTRAVLDGNEYIINGSKTFITNGGHADFLCVVAKTNPDERAKGVSLIMVETEGLDGFKRGAFWTK